MFVVVNRLQAIPGYSHGTVVSVYRNGLEALIEDPHLSSREGQVTFISDQGCSR
jgi:hypothetical protein